MKITQELLKELLKYDKETGKLWWKPRGLHLFEDGPVNSASTRQKVWNKRFAGREAGTYVGTTGYPCCTVMATKYPNHRLIWLLVVGHWPDNIDHIDGNRVNNSWGNLREVSVSENRKNVCRHHANTSGVSGVTWNKAKNRWQARLGREHWLGLFDDFNEAVEARKAAEQSHGYHKNHGRERS